MAKRGASQIDSSRRPDHRVTALSIISGLLVGALAVIGVRMAASAGAPAELASPHARMHAHEHAPVHDTAPASAPSEPEPIEAASLIDRPRRVLPPPELHPRPASEWQGMRVDLNMQSICDGIDTCGLAMSCHENRCGPCSFDSDCARGESCVLDHCVPSPNVECQVAGDCAAGELCVLSGYSTDPRGNGDMHAYCQRGEGGHMPDPELHEQELAELEPGPPAAPRPVSITELRRELVGDPGFPTAMPTDPPAPLEPLPDAAPTEELPDEDLAFFDEEAEEALFQEGDPIDFIDPEPDPDSAAR